MASRIRVMLVDDRAEVRNALGAFFATEACLEVVAEASDGREAIALAGQCNPDVILMDLLMPEVNGVKAIRVIRSANPDLRAIILTSFGSEDLILDAILAGSCGCLLKDGAPEDLVTAIQKVDAGETVLATAVANRLVAINGFKNKLDRLRLSPGERELGCLIARGMSYEEIGSQLDRPARQIEVDVNRFLSRYRFRNRLEAMLHTIAIGLENEGSRGLP